MLTCVVGKLFASFMEKKDVVDQLDWNCFTNARPKGCKNSSHHESSEIIRLRRSNDTNDELKLLEIMNSGLNGINHTKSNDPSITGRRPNLRYIGTRIKDPNP